MMKNGARKKYIALAAVSLCVFAVLAALLVFTVCARRAERRQTASLAALYVAPEGDGGEAADASVTENAGIPARFSTLYAANPELIGWLRVGDIVDEPVVLRDNSFYLSHGFDRQPNNSGTVFADEENASWYSDDYVILYGHNIHDGSKFAPLSKYKKLDFLKANPVIEWDTVRSGDAAGEYAVFALFDASMLPDDDGYFHLRRFDELREGGDEAMQTLIDELKTRSLADIPLDVAPGDRILALVTCSYSNADGRLLIFTRALRGGETAENVSLAVAEAKERA